MPRTTVSIAEKVADRIVGRAERGMHPPNLAAAAAAELAVFDSLLAQELRRVRLTEVEARALAAVLAGSAFEPYATGPLLFAEAADAFRLARADDPTGGEMSSYAAQYGVDEQALLGKLLAGGPTADLALRDALSRWWDSPSEADEVSFRAVGMVIIDAPAEQR